MQMLCADSKIMPKIKRKWWGICTPHSHAHIAMAIAWYVCNTLLTSGMQNNYIHARREPLRTIIVMQNKSSQILGLGVQSLSSAIFHPTLLLPASDFSTFRTKLEGEKRHERRLLHWQSKFHPPSVSQVHPLSACMAPSIPSHIIETPSPCWRLGRKGNSTLFYGYEGVNLCLFNL